MFDTTCYRLLVVDDDSVDRMAIKRAIRKAGVQAIWTEATRAEEAFDLAVGQTFDCVFLDYGLPDQDGLSVVETLKEQGLQSPIVVLTGQGDEQIAVSLMKAGVVDYLSKSQMTPEALLRILRNAQRVWQAEQAVLKSNAALKQRNHQLLQQNKLLEEQKLRLQSQQEKLLEADEMKSEFLAAMTHDFRTPLVAANRMFKLIEEQAFGSVTPQLLDVIATMTRNNQSLLQMVNTLLEVYRHEAGQHHLAWVDFSIPDLVDEVLQELQPLAEQKAITLRLEAPQTESGVPAMTWRGDRLELRRVLTNLIGNAIKFTDEGGVTLAWQLSPVDVSSEGDPLAARLSICVRDSGIGLDAGQQQSIFSRFQRGQHRRSGAGLGLYLSKRIVEAHGGRLWVESVKGQGSQFFLELPQV